MKPALFCLSLFLLLAGWSHAGVSDYTDPGKADFDTALQILNPYGTWAKRDGRWAYTPLDHIAPYTDGRWIYTEYGWCWKGNLPHSWVTEHYGYWKRGADKIWSWYPGSYWLPQIVEIRASSSHIGWRCAAVDHQGNFTEKPLDRFTKTDEWTFVTLAQFANPLTPDLHATPEVTKAQLEDSTDCRHTYLTYRIIDRPGPHPADFYDLCKDGGMLAPRVSQEAQPPPSAMRTAHPQAQPVPTTGTHAPALVGTEIDPTADTRKVKYWITMSLPSYWAKPPPDARLDEVYLYRPEFWQDEDGIERRITLWFNPRARVSLKEALAGGLAGAKPGASAAPKDAAPAATRKDPFQSPLDETIPLSIPPTQSSKPSSKHPQTPPDARSELAPIPAPFVNTNTAPVNPP